MSGPGCEVLVLDVHGVVLNNPLRGFFDKLAELTGQDRDGLHRLWDTELRMLAWTGQIDDEQLWRRLAGDRRHDPHDLRGRLEASYEPGPVAPYLSSWRERVPLWLLSNHRSHWLIPRLQRFGLWQHFDRILVSDQIGAAKPSLRTFRPVLEAVRTPAAALFLDDQMRNVESARQLGLTAHQVTETGEWTEEVATCLAARGRVA